MTTTRWQRIDEIYLQAADLGAAEREPFLAAECGGDETLLNEVRALLAYQQAAEGFLEDAALAEEARALVEDAGPSLVGRDIGGYRILSSIGMGGMGEVYRATDLKLGRDAALKVLGRFVTAEPEALKRFEEEARLASGLNHPNIVTIYGVGEDQGITFLAMEFVDGQTLRSMCAANPVPIDRVLDLGVQMADALAAAHGIGIIHGDLKPENVMVTKDGLVKVLDFGLARRQSAALTWRTADGFVRGSPGYMSPERAAGGGAGAPSDQFSLGAILFEMVTGRRAFDRPDGPGVPPAAWSNPSLGKLIDRCLAKESSQRFADTRELAAELRRISANRGAASLTRRQALWLTAAAAVAAAGGTVWWTRPVPARFRSIAVLPFANDEPEGYVGDGITENLIRRISQLSSLKVAARTTVSNFKGKSIEARAAGQRLSVDVVLSGLVTRKAGQLRISAELTDVATGARLWGQAYDRPTSDIVAVQDEIADAVIEEGGSVRLPRGEGRLARHPTDDPDAYELYLRGMHHIGLETEEDYLKARALLRQAIEKDPAFALAHLALASTYAVMAIDGFERPTDAWPQSDRNMRRALEIDAHLPDAYGAAASELFFYRWNWPAAAHEWRTALDPSSGQLQPDLLIGYALQNWALGRFDEALRLTRQARQLDPLSSIYKIREADLLVQIGRIDDALQLYGRVIEDEPADPRAYFGVAEARRLQRRFSEAIEARTRAHEVVGDTALQDILSSAHGEDGYRRIEQRAAEMQLDALMTRAATGYTSPLDLSRLHALLGRKDLAFRFMEAAFQDRSAGLVFLKVDRSWDALRSDGRFAAAVKRVGLS